MKIFSKACGFYLFGLVLLSLCSSANANVVLRIRGGIHETFTRIVLDIQKRPHLKVTVAQRGHQIRLFGPKLSYVKKLPAFPRNLIKSMNLQSFRADVSEITLEMPKPVKIVKSFVLNPSAATPYFRYVIDVQEIAEKTAPSPKADGPRKAISPAKEVSSVRKKSLPTVKKPSKRVIVIDPGHGGKDLGASGKGITEKDITLQIAKILKEIIEKKGHYDVRLTRETDVFLTLGQRVSFARTAKADLFISLHADSHPRADTRGLSVYTLSKVASDSEAEKLAIKENKADLLDTVNLKAQSPEVANILIDLMKRETMNLSRHAAHHLIAKLRKRVLLLRTPIRSADFAVLRTPELPGILVEMGYISNKQDEKLLTTPYHQVKLCEGILEGIDHYFEQHAIS